MARIPGLRRLFRIGDTASAVQRDAEDEVRFHLEMKVQELVAKGMSPEVARQEALRRFGDVHRTRESIERIDRERLGRERRAAWWSAVAQDVRYALRGLGRQPAFTAVVVLTLALAIGANATMFGIVDRLLLRPPAHVQEPDRLARVFFVRQPKGMQVRHSDRHSYPMYAMLRDSVAAFEATAAVFTMEQIYGTGVDARGIRGSLVTGGFFELLGVRPAHGRFFAPDEDRPGAGQPVAVLGNDFWRSEFGGEREVLGREIRLGRTTYTIVGVAPAGFSGIELERVDVWLPMSAAAPEVIDEQYHEARSVRWLQILARFAPGASPERANVEATRMWHSYIRGGSESDAAEELAEGPKVEVASIIRERGPNRSEGSRIAVWVAGVAAIVLVIACANVANLLLARAMRRRREIAVRLALGVGRRRLVGQLLTESLLLAVIGGIAGVLVAHWGGALLRSVLLPDIAWNERILDPRVLAFTGAAALFTGILAGIAPALQASRPDIAGALKAGAREGSYQKSRVRTGLLLSQAALSVVLLVGAGLFVISLRNVRMDDLGYDPEHVALIETDYRGQDVPRAERLEAYRRAHDRLERIPGVQVVALGTTTPFWSMFAGPLRVRGLDSVPKIESGSPLLHVVSHDYLDAMGTRVSEGRGFTEEDDRRGAARVALVNETMAKLLWPDQSPIGQCLYVGPNATTCSDVVGVVQDSRSDEIRPIPVMKYYVPVEQEQWAGSIRILFVRTEGDPRSLIGEMRREVVAAAPQATYVDIRPLMDLLDPEVRPWRLGATMFTVFGALALVLAAVGLYSVMAYSVTQRTHEMGVRMALGAEGRDVLRLIVGEGMRLAVIGIVAGALIALVATRWVAPLLYDVAPNDPRVFGGVALALLAVAVLASTIPAWRAARVPPITALRAE